MKPFRPVTLALVPLALAAVRAQPTNIDVLRSLATDAAAEVRTQIPTGTTDSFTVVVLPADVAWILEEGIRNAFTPSASPGTPAGVRVVVALKDAGVTYDAYEREGIFGRRTAGRTVRLVLTAAVTRESSGERMFGGDVSRERTDRIPVAEFGRVDHPTLPLARGKPAEEGFFQDVAEPLILIGAIGVTVFLLFHVRS